jgi:hypothetical protein
MGDGSEVCVSHAVRGTTYVLALCFCSRHASHDSFLDPFPLELCQCREDVELELARWRRAVDAFPETHERHANVIQVFEHSHQMAQIASEPVETPADTSKRRRLASFSKASSAGRLSFAPLTPVSTYSVACQPRASQ